MKTKKQIQQGCARLLLNREYTYCNKDVLCPTCQAQLEMIEGFEKEINKLIFEWEAEDKRNNLVQHIISDLKQLKQKING